MDDAFNVESRRWIVAQRHPDGRVSALFTVDNEHDARDLAHDLRTRSGHVEVAPTARTTRHPPLHAAHLYDQTTVTCPGTLSMHHDCNNCGGAEITAARDQLDVSRAARAAPVGVPPSHPLDR